MTRGGLKRLDEIMRRLRRAAPFADGQRAMSSLDAIVRAVEDELSGIPENPNAVSAPPDGRIYPPHENFEIASGCDRVRLFKQTRHRTYFGDNGAIQIVRSDGAIEVDLKGIDNLSVTDLLGDTP